VFFWLRLSAAFGTGWSVPEIGARSGSGRGLAIFALAFLVVYDFGRYLAHQRAIEILNSRIYSRWCTDSRGSVPTGFVNPFEWSGWVERPEFGDALFDEPAGRF